jgi:hypothetical protein
MGASWQVLKKDKELLIFPILSTLACLLVIVSFAVPLVATGAWQPPTGEEATAGDQVFFYGIMFLFYFCNYFVITFFNSAIVGSAITRMGGGEPTFGDALGTAFSRLPQILGWALLAATVGLILRIIEDRSKRVGQIVAGLLGMAWTVVTFMVVPVIVVEKCGPFSALKRSTVLLKKTWGEQLIGGFSFGIIFFLLGLPGIALIVLGVFLLAQAGALPGALCIGAGLLYMIVMWLVQTTLETIFKAAVYVYAAKGQTPAGFSGEMLGSAMATK